MINQLSNIGLMKIIQKVRGTNDTPSPTFQKVEGHVPPTRMTFIWHRDFSCNIQVKRCESDRIFGLSVMMNGSSILFINVYFPVGCQITLAHMLVMVAKRVHGFIILQCPMFRPSLRLTATPSRMLHAQITVLLQLH